MSAALSDAERDAVADALVGAGEPLTGGLRAELISGGRSNVTIRLEDDARRWVLRMPPRHGRTPSAHDVGREYRVTKGLWGSGVPVARPVVFEEDSAALGGPFAVWEFVDGTVVQSREALDGIDATSLDEIVTGLTRTLATLHRVDHVAVGLERLGRPDAYFERQLKRWSGQWALVSAHDGPTEAAERELRGRLAGAVPVQRATGIVHGDYRIDNVLLGGPRGTETAAVVDWELATIGDPVADVATMCAYRHPAFDHVLGFRTAWTSPRLPSADAIAAAYAAAGGVELTAWDAYLALAHYKIAIIAAGIDFRFREGGRVDAAGASAGAAVRPFLEAGLSALAAR